MVPRRRLVAGVVLSLLCVWSIEASAATIVGVQIGTSSWVCPTNSITCTNFPSSNELIYTDSGVVAGPLEVITGASATLLGNLSQTQIIGRASQGTLRGLASADVNTSSGTAMSQAGLNAVWFDELTLSHPTLPVGSPIQFMASHGLSWIFSGTTLANCGGLNSLAVSSQFSLVGTLTDQCQSAGHIGASSVVNALVGDTLAIWGQLIIGAYVVDGGQVSLSANVLNTANYFIDPLTPGLTYTTASGATYLTPNTTPVPEPTSLSLLGLGALTLTLRSRRRARLILPN